MSEIPSSTKTTRSGKSLKAIRRYYAMKNRSPKSASKKKADDKISHRIAAELKVHQEANEKRFDKKEIPDDPPAPKIINTRFEPEIKASAFFIPSPQSPPQTNDLSQANSIKDQIKSRTEKSVKSAKSVATVIKVPSIKSRVAYRGHPNENLLITGNLPFGILLCLITFSLVFIVTWIYMMIQPTPLILKSSDSHSPIPLFTTANPVISTTVRSNNVDRIKRQTELEHRESVADKWAKRLPPTRWIGLTCIMILISLLPWFVYPGRLISSIPGFISLLGCFISLSAYFAYYSLKPNLKDHGLGTERNPLQLFSIITLFILVAAVLYIMFSRLLATFIQKTTFGSEVGNGSYRGKNSPIKLTQMSELMQPELH